MLALRIRTFTAVAAFLAAVACGSDGTTAPNLDEPLPPLASTSLEAGPFSAVLPAGAIATSNDARSRALVLFPGATITDIDLNDVERGLAVAEVKLLPGGGGGEVKLHFSRQNGLLAEAEGEDPPFTYPFEPGGGYASLAQAIGAATGSAGKAGTVTTWKLQLEENTIWQYRVWVAAADGEWRIRVYARTAAVNRVQRR
jgi:uncharacterized membrane protein YkoI